MLYALLEEYCLYMYMLWALLEVYMYMLYALLGEFCLYMHYGRVLPVHAVYMHYWDIIVCQ